MAAERGTSNETEVTHQLTHDQLRSLRRLEATDCDRMRCALQFNKVIFHFRWEKIYVSCYISYEYGYLDRS